MPEATLKECDAEDDQTRTATVSDPHPALTQLAIFDSDLTWLLGDRSASCRISLLRSDVELEKKKKKKNQDLLHRYFRKDSLMKI